MAVQFKGGVVIGADSRTTSGSYIVGRSERNYTQATQTDFTNVPGQSRNGQAHECP
jgi:20S proteasome subunit beta 1